MTAHNSGKVGGLLLAAGGSSRLGQPKQLIQFRGKTLLRRAAETLVDSECDLVVVVVGTDPESSRSEIGDLEIDICNNERWQAGMSSSIRAGMRELLKIEPGIAAVVIALCDQPNVTSADIDRLIGVFRNSASPIVAAEYEDTNGVPALFSREIFDELAQLEGDKGARQIIRSRADRVRTVKIENAAFDIDTLDDIDRLTRN